VDHRSPGWLASVQLRLYQQTWKAASRLPVLMGRVGNLDGSCPWVLSPHSIFEGEGGPGEGLLLSSSSPLPALFCTSVSSSLTLDLLQLTESWDR